MAIDPSGTTTLDAWQPDHEGRLLAYQLSEGGREESVVRVMEIATGEDVDGPIDRCRYTEIAWLPGGKAFYYARRLAPGQVPAGEEQYHRRVYLHQVGTSARGRRADPRRRPGQDHLLRRRGQPGRPVAGHRGVAGHRAAQRRVGG